MNARRPGREEFLPVTADDVRARGWDAPDVVFITGDAYVDHPAFAAALLGRVLEADGLRVAILAQPDWRSAEAFRALGRPNLAFAISAGNLDSMLARYTAGRKLRSEDGYTPGGVPGRRPERATIVYAQRAREAFPGVPIVVGGVEASLRRLAHYDYWTDRVRGSLLLDAKADLLVYGMGEAPLRAIVHRLAAGQDVRALRDVPGTCYATGASEAPPDGVALPSLEEVVADPDALGLATRLVVDESRRAEPRVMVQAHGRRHVVQNPPPAPEEAAELDRYYDLPFTRAAHPSVPAPVPALTVVRDSITIHRGCFAGCAFCSLALHQGPRVRSRSEASVLREARTLAARPDFPGTITDLGGPTANMYGLGCGDPRAHAECRRRSCLVPAICRHLRTDHARLTRLMADLARVPGVKRVLVASGVRTDLALGDPAYMRALAREHTGGQLSVAPEHVAKAALASMGKPGIAVHEAFAERFDAESRGAGKEQYLVPYFLVGHPGTDLAAAIELALYLKRKGLRPRQVQEFIPLPMDAATAMFVGGRDPWTGEAVHVPKERERRLQKALAQYFLPENHARVREALRSADRADLIGRGADALVPPDDARAGKRPAARPTAARPPARRPGTHRPK
jgi:uncharacterized radical SAM protein YgiQ